MAKRIAVVLSQLKGANPAQRELEGDVVAELLMVHGLEVTLVTDLTTLAHDDTGILCLEGITGDMVMLSWTPAVEAHRQLAERGIGGRLGRTAICIDDCPSDALHGNPAPRTIYHIDLRSVRNVKDCGAEIERIRNEATIQVVGLGLTDASQPAAADVSASGAALRQPASRSPASPAAPVQPAPGAASSSNEPDFDDDDPSLDELMKQFDAWDV